jgi:hypothetical protein
MAMRAATSCSSITFNSTPAFSANERALFHCLGCSRHQHPQFEGLFVHAAVMPGKRCRLNRSMQHWLGVHVLEFESLKFYGPPAVTFSSPLEHPHPQIPKSGNQPNFPKELPPEIHPNTITLKQ